MGTATITSDTTFGLDTSLVDEHVYTVPTLAESVQMVHQARKALNVPKATKTAKPRKGDVVGYVDESGEIGLTAEFVRSPGATYAMVQWDHNGTSTMINWTRATRIGNGSWLIYPETD